MSKDTDRCPSFTETSGYRVTRKLRCQLPVGHEDQCSYHRDGSQGGSMLRWWGANPRPVGSLGDYGYAELNDEVWRLRALCDDHGIDWKEGLAK